MKNLRIQCEQLLKVIEAAIEKSEPSAAPELSAVTSEAVAELIARLRLDLSDANQAAANMLEMLEAERDKYRQPLKSRGLI